jgi:hypothetical protein
MAKKRYTVWLSRPLAHKFEAVAARSKGGKSGVVEDALKAVLEPQLLPGVNDALARRFESLNRTVAQIERDMAITTETLGLFVRYFLTVTPPMPESEQEPARLLGRERFAVFVVEVGRRMTSDRRLVAEVLESIAKNDPDLFGTLSSSAAGPAPEKSQDAAAQPAGDNAVNGAGPENGKDGTTLLAGDTHE